MKNLVSKRQLNYPLTYAYLCSVWYVDADSTYCNIKRKEKQPSEYIAVRTISGCGTLTEFGGQKHELRENSLGIFCSADVARYESSLQGWQFYWFRFDHADWKSPCNQVYDLNISMSERQDLERCFIYLNSGNEHECILAESLFHYLLSNWFVRLAEKQNKTISLQDIVCVLEKGRQQKQNLQEMAKELGMCERSFREAVRRATGKPPKEYMTKIEMETAMDLLQTTDMSVSEISTRLNFENPFYFSRVFKKQFGISPKEVRKI